MKSSDTARFTTSDLITYTVEYIRNAAEALRRECDLSISRYRMLAYLSDHVEGEQPSRLARTLRVSPSLIAVESNRLEQEKLVRRYGSRARESRRSIVITKCGIDKSRDGDVVLTTSHERYFAPLPTNMRITIESGSMLTNLNSDEGNRLRDGHFFAAFETLHAFLIVESYLTTSAQSCALSLGEFRVLFELSEWGGAARPSLLSGTLLMSRPLIAHWLGDLERRGLVEMVGDPVDRRSKIALLTAPGEEKLAKASERIESVFTTDVRRSVMGERSIYKDAAALVVGSLRKRTATMQARSKGIAPFNHASV